METEIDGKKLYNPLFYIIKADLQYDEFDLSPTKKFTV